MYDETRGCGCVPVIRAEYVPLDGRIEIRHCVCEKLRNRRTLVEGGSTSSYGRCCQENRFRKVAGLFAYKKQDTL